ncbi:MAG: UDP-N-acetylmuramoyl-L-alanine--D-glutamate ligase, partial [Muribaculaceae bacterium]|nr:UDP-N-acetylmuramoyl-L-alanine--D-glutamate ligase [Muribaculaceae bacterium]
MENKRIVVLGGGESGVGAAILAKVKGFDVFLSDMGSISDRYKQALAQYEIPFEEGGHTEPLILNASEVVKSPGIPPTAPLIKKLVALGTPI